MKRISIYKGYNYLTFDPSSGDFIAYVHSPAGLYDYIIKYLFRNPEFRIKRNSGFETRYTLRFANHDFKMYSKFC